MIFVGEEMAGKESYAVLRMALIGNALIMKNKYMPVVQIHVDYYW